MRVPLTLWNQNCNDISQFTLKQPQVRFSPIPWPTKRAERCRANWKTLSLFVFEFGSSSLGCSLLANQLYSSASRHLIICGYNFNDQDRTRTHNSAQNIPLKGVRNLREYEKSEKGRAPYNMRTRNITESTVL
jgi:hypothetical protein